MMDRSDPMDGTADSPLLTFGRLAAIPCVRHALITRIPDIDVDCDRDEALARLAPVHERLIRTLGWGERPVIRCGQVHGAEVAVVDAATRSPVSATDGLVTTDPDVILGVYVADCCPVSIIDPVAPAVGLVHSGRRGTELNIVGAAIRTMTELTGTPPANLIVHLGPCIRPPRYEVDFAAEIRGQAAARGVGAIADCGLCTGSDLRRFYSHRMENGRTGRMLALLGLAAE